MVIRLTTGYQSNCVKIALILPTNDTNMQDNDAGSSHMPNGNCTVFLLKGGEFSISCIKESFYLNKSYL